MIKDFFYYTRTERKGIIVLIFLIIICFIIPFFINSESDEMGSDDKFQTDYQSFIYSIEILNRQERDKYNHLYPNLKQKIVLTPFDPNTADSLTFLRLGLPSWMVRNILKYRAKGGRFKKPEEFGKIYGLTAQQFNVLYPYIVIKGERRDTVKLLTKRDTLLRYPVKYAANVRVELNSADTTELKKIPGIGSGIARMIVRYRQQLGGFYSIRQLSEIHLISDRLIKWFTIDASLIRKINLNKAGISRLNSHPYISFYQAKVIIEHRRKYGPLSSLKQLALYEEFSVRDFDRMGPYVAFN